MIRSIVSSASAALLLALLAAGPALAEDAAAPPKAAAKGVCKADVQRFCPEVKPGGGRLMACLHEHVPDLNPDCATALAAAEAKRANAAPK